MSTAVLIVAAILLALGQPLSKPLLGDAFSLQAFCLLMLTMRVFAQIPSTLFLRQWRIGSVHQAGSLLALGAAGAAIQLGSYYGIAAGIPVSTSTFLISTHPIWTLLLGRVLSGEKPGIWDVSRATLACAGVAFIAGETFDGAPSTMALLSPLLAGFGIALWVRFSGTASRTGSSIYQISFYYDVFCLAFLGILFAGKSGLIREVLNPSPGKLMALAAYTLFTALIPNYLFYWAANRIHPNRVSLVLLLEPIVSAVTSRFMFGDTFSPLFALGAAAVVVANLPDFGPKSAQLQAS